MISSSRIAHRRYRPSFRLRHVRAGPACRRLGEKAVFAISQLPNDQSVPMLAELMKTHRDPGVRRKAAFWLGQKNDPRALAAIEDILRK